jgi:predicted nuclease of restriction endonuclease-like (RecB) superfamily
MTDNIDNKDYARFLKDVESRIQSARISAGRAVNRELILLYWDIGRVIMEKQEALGWGHSVIDRLSRDLRTVFPAVTGFSPRNLRDMKRFYTAYSVPEVWRQVVAKLNQQGSVLSFDEKWRQVVAKTDQEGVSEQFMRQVVAEIPWGHHLAILNKIVDPASRLYYLRATAKFGWSRNVLLNQIKAGAYERSLTEGKTHNFPAALPEHLAEQAEEALKSSYNLEFLGISREIKERELEDLLIEQLQAFILELGYGFCFVGRQYRLTLGKKEYFIDLLFYHRFLKSLVAVELKVGSFKPEHAGKMDFYLNILNEKEQAEGDNSSIGIILCAEKDNLEVEFALKSKTNPIGVAEYQLLPTLPKELKGKIPTPKQLSEALRFPAKNHRD